MRVLEKRLEKHIELLLERYPVLLDASRPHLHLRSAEGKRHPAADRTRGRYRMTKQECAIVTAYTDISMLRGDDLKYLYKYLSGFLGRPVYTHEIPAVCMQFRDRIREDFIALCRDAEEADVD